MVIQVHGPTSNAEEAEAEWFYENLQDLLSHFLGRLIRSLGVPKERGVWNSQGGRKDKLFFPLYIPYDYIIIMYPARGQSLD